MAPSPFPQARWKFERTETGVNLVIWTDQDSARYQVQPLRFPMHEAEAWRLVHGGDRVMSWAAQAAEGTFTAGPTPAQAASQLGVRRYVVTSKDVETHTRMVQATPWANWVAGEEGADGTAWHVDVFAVDDPQFLQEALALGVTVAALAGD